MSILLYLLHDSLATENKALYFPQLPSLTQLMTGDKFVITLKTSKYRTYFNINFAFNLFYFNLRFRAAKAKACPALGHKWHMPLMNQIRGAYASSPPFHSYRYAPDEIRTSMFLPLMKKSSHGGQTPKLDSIQI